MGWVAKNKGAWLSIHPHKIHKYIHTRISIIHTIIVICMVRINDLTKPQKNYLQSLHKQFNCIWKQSYFHHSLLFSQQLKKIFKWKQSISKVWTNFVCWRKENSSLPIYNIGSVQHNPVYHIANLILCTLKTKIKTAKI